MRWLGVLEVVSENGFRDGFVLFCFLSSKSCFLKKNFLLEARWKFLFVSP